MMILKALALQAAGDTRHAESALVTGLTLAEPEGYVRTFLDEGEPMRMLLRRWAAHAGADPRRSYGERLLAQFDVAPKVAASATETIPGSDDLIEPLTRRELEVLQLICAGESNHAIADHLVITVSAVKKHTGNIFGKLGVTSRAQAMVKARELGLFSGAK